MNTEYVYEISSSSDAACSSLDGQRYVSDIEALQALVRASGKSVVADNGWSDVDKEGRTCDAFGVYALAEDRKANDEGKAPHLMLAVVRRVLNGVEA